MNHLTEELKGIKAQMASVSVWNLYICLFQDEQPISRRFITREVFKKAALSESNQKSAWDTRQSLASVNVSHEESGELFKPSEIPTVLADLSEMCNLLTLHRRLHLQMCWDSLMTNHPRNECSPQHM